MKILMLLWLEETLYRGERQKIYLVLEYELSSVAAILCIIVRPGRTPRNISPIQPALFQENLSYPRQLRPAMNWGLQDHPLECEVDHLRSDSKRRDCDAEMNKRCNLFALTLRRRFDDALATIRSSAETDHVRLR